MIDENYYIKLLADNSPTIDHELIEECLNEFGVIGTRELTVHQLKSFCESKGILVVSKKSNK